jgi:hypothetical protein
MHCAIQTPCANGITHDIGLFVLFVMTFYEGIDVTKLVISKI